MDPFSRYSLVGSSGDARDFQVKIPYMAAQVVEKCCICKCMMRQLFNILNNLVSIHFANLLVDNVFF